MLHKHLEVFEVLLQVRGFIMELKLTHFYINFSVLENVFVQLSQIILISLIPILNLLTDYKLRLGLESTPHIPSPNSGKCQKIQSL